MAKPLSIAHILNPVIVDKRSDLYAAQPITFSSIDVAAEFCRDEINLSLFSAQFEEDHPIIPDLFSKTPDLERSIKDIPGLQDMKKLPLICDILERLSNAAPEADYYIYTNVDIAIQPYFYNTVKQIIEMGYDSFSINRRTILDYTEPCTTQQLYAKVGESHPGSDCFVFKRELLSRFQLSNACIGANHIGRILKLNLFAFARNFRTFGDLHATFHIGDDRTWRNEQYNPVEVHNKAILDSLLSQFSQQGMIGPEVIDDIYPGRNKKPKKKKRIASLIESLAPNRGGKSGSIK